MSQGHKNEQKVGSNDKFHSLNEQDPMGSDFMTEGATLTFTSKALTPSFRILFEGSQDLGLS